MTSPCSGDKRAKDRCSNSARVFFCSTVSGSSAGSATLEAIAPRTSFSVAEKTQPQPGALAATDSANFLRA
jgi:hypothetical protein